MYTNMLMKFLTIKENSSTRHIVKSLNFVAHTLLLLTIVCVFVHFSPVMPTEGLDPSWTFGMNQAVAQGLAFGRSMIFTFGPYAAIYTKAYHPATDHLMLFGGLYLGVSYWICLCTLTAGKRFYFAFAFSLVLAGLMHSRDALLFSYPLLAGLICFNVLRDGKTNSTQKAPLIWIIIALFPFGLMPLIKGSFLVLCGAILILSCILFLTSQKWTFAIAAVLAPAFSTVFFWAASGQTIFDLPVFFVSIFPIVSGYTEAMATSGKVHEIIYYLIAAFLLLIAVYREKTISFIPRSFLFCVLFVFLFLTFKGGFVRHDGHALLPGLAILLAALFFALTLASRYALAALLASFFVWANIDSNYIKTSTTDLSRNINTTYFSAWSGLVSRLNGDKSLETEFNNALKSLNEKSKIPMLEGTTDIYSYNQSYLLASGNSWSPRPILQSYSAYTPLLAEKNKNHLLGENAPDNLIFRVEPIDGRVPSIEDGPSWPVFLSRYHPTAIENDFLYLRKKVSTSEDVKLFQATNGTYQFGEEVFVPSTAASPIFAEIFISPTFFGRVANLFFKSSEIQISLNLESGEIKKYRLNPEMAKSTFMVSPLIETTSEFSMLYGKSDYLTGKRVKSISISAGGSKWLWENDYMVSFRQIDAGPNFDATSESELAKAYVAEISDASTGSDNSAIQKSGRYH